MERVEHGEVALAGDAEGELGAVDDELVDEEPAARPHAARSSGGARGRPRPSAAWADPRPRRRRSGSSASPSTRRAAPGRGRRPSAGAERTLRAPDPDRTRTTRRPARTTRSAPRSSRRVGRGGGSGSPGPGCVCVYATPPGGKSTRSQRSTHSANGSSWTGRESERGLGLLGRRVELPDERVALDLGGAEVGGVVRDVVDDPLPAGGLRSGHELVERQPHGAQSNARASGVSRTSGLQWKYCPPSMTIVWPVTNADPGPAK